MCWCSPNCLCMYTNGSKCCGFGGKGTLSTTKQETIYIVYYFSGSFSIFFFEIGGAVCLLLLWLIGQIHG